MNMNIFIKQTPLENIEDGYKTVEIRLYRNNSISKKVKDIKLFNSFEDLYNLENIECILPGINSKECFINHYQNIYKNYKLDYFKVVAFYI